MPPSELATRIVALAESGVGHDFVLKRELAAAQRVWLRDLVRVLGLREGTHEIRVGSTGPGVAADVFLRTDELCVHFSEAFCRGSFGLLAWRCGGVHGPARGPNKWVRPDDFAAWSIEEVACSILLSTKAHPAELARLVESGCLAH